MTAVHEFKCDACRRKVAASHNGEHYLPPMDWVAIWNPHTAELTGEHLCGQCKWNPTKKKPEKKC